MINPIEWKACESNPNHPDIALGDRVRAFAVDMRGVPGYDVIVPAVSGTVVGFVTGWFGGKTYGTVVKWDDGNTGVSMMRNFDKL